MSCSITRSKAASSGPTLSFRGLDNAAYYKLEPTNLAHYVNRTGSGNTIAIGHAAVRNS